MNLAQALKTYKYQLAVTLLIVAGVYYRIVPSMVSDWYNDANYSHGFLVPLIAGYLLYQRRGELMETHINPDTRGLFVLLGGLVPLALAFAGTELFTMRASILVVISGIVYYYFGRDVLKKAALPIGYLFFMVPLPYILYNAVAFPLKLFVAKYAVLFLQAIGIIVVREGNIIIFPNVTFEVADACSGIRSIMSLLALSTALAFVVPISAARKWIIIISAIPIAVFTNWLRVVITGILAQYWGQKAAEGFFHEFAGVVIFAVAILLLFFLLGLLRRTGK